MNRRLAFFAIGVAGWITVGAAQEPLPANVAFRLKEAARIVERAERTLGGGGVASETWKIESTTVAAKEARAKMAEIEQRYGGKYDPGHPEIVAMHNRIAALEASAGGRAAAQQAAQAADAQQAAAAGAASDDWLAQLTPYTTGLGRPGYDAAKYLVPSATQDEAEMRNRLGIYAEAVAVLAKYRQANLGELATEELRQTTAQLESALREFGESCVEYAGQDLAAAEAAITRLEDFVRAQDANLAAGRPALFPERSTLESAQAILERGAGLAASGDPRPASLRARLAALTQADARLRAARAADTRPGPDAYSGGDASDLKKFAEQVVFRAQPGLRLLKTVIVSPDWEEENVVEWTDTTRTALRHRTTRSVTAQVAGRHNANVRLYTVHLRQDRSANGSWGPTAGHVMFTDPMLEENAR